MNSVVEILKALYGPAVALAYSTFENRNGGVCRPDTKTPACKAGAEEELDQMKQDATGFCGLFKPGRQSMPAMDTKSFRKQLAWLIKEQPVAVKMTVNPDMAKVMLERNNTDEWKNRPASATGVTRFARAMSQGRWHYTAETIVFSESGRLLNGQHRLTACVTANAEIDVLAAFGVDDDAFKYMDIGVTRTAGHIFAIEGVPHYNFTASACRIVRAYLSSETWSGNAVQGGDNAQDNDQLLAFYHEHDRIHESYAFARKMDGLLSPRWAGAMHYICSQRNRQLANEFFNTVGTGVGIVSDSSAEHLIRKRLLQASMAHGDGKESEMFLSAYLIQAWNSKRKGNGRKILRWRSGQIPNESFPRAI